MGVKWKHVAVSYQFSWCTVYSANIRQTKRQSNPITGLDRSWGFQEVEAPRFQDNRHMKVVRLSALRTGRFYPPGNIPGTHFCQRPSRPQGHSAAWRITSMKNSNDTIGNRTRDLLACSAVPQTTAPLPAPNIRQNRSNVSSHKGRINTVAYNINIRLAVLYPVQRNRGIQLPVGCIKAKRLYHGTSVTNIC